MSAAASCACVLVAAAPTAHALPNATNPGDIQVTAVETQPVVECGGHTLYVNGSNNVVTATDACYAVLYKDGDPDVWDRGRELGMTNRIDRVPA